MTAKDIIRGQIIQWLGTAYDEKIGDTSNPDYFGPIAVEEVVTAIHTRLETLCTDLNPKENYSKVCAYCGRPAESKYG